MAIERSDRDRDRNDVILMPRQYAIVKDMTKGNLNVHVGPTKITLSDAERLMVPDPKNPSRLVEVGNQDAAILPYVDVGESDYVVLSNPSASETAVLKPRSQNDMVELQFGRKVNIPGPVSFPLWPFQAVDVIKGHQLNMNQYLVVKVINDVEAANNWNKGIVKSVESTEKTKGITRPVSLSIGQLIIIKGTEVSFYIPPTGLEVVKDTTGNYVRDAVTLEQLEYCVLVDQNGEKRFEQGPKVVFPTASEEFIEEDNSKKYKATELTEISGLHIKVTAPYSENGVNYKIGDELFVTGKDTPIYFPRAEHALVKYGNRVKHYATAIPKGEGRYVLNRLTGEIRLVRGPKMLLPDPRTEVIVRRILSEKQVELWYPGNAEAMNLNRSLNAAAAQENNTSGYLSSDDYGLMHDTAVSGAAYPRAFAAAAMTPTKFVGDQMSRRETYTPPRTVTLNTKYDGAVQIGVWTGYAVLVVDKNGNREVVVGPQTVLLEFDQELASMEFSTGKPKTTDRLYKTSYLRVLNNQVSDIVDAMTSDDIPVRIRTSYRVNFLPEYKDKWFDAENYVKLLCDHVRSKLRNVVKKLGIQEFQDKYIDLVRDTVLGVATVDAKTGDKTPRPGLTFQENGAHVYDVEVLGLEIGDRAIAEQLLTAQRNTIGDALKLATSKRQLMLAQEQEAINQKLEELRAATTIQKVGLQKQVLKETTELTLAELARETETFKSKQIIETEKQKVIDLANWAELERNRLGAEQALAKEKEELALRLQETESETKNLAERTKALTPDMVAALQRFGDMALAEKMADSMAPMALLGGKSVKEVLSGLLLGTGLEKLTSAINLGNNGNGNGNRAETVQSSRY